MVICVISVSCTQAVFMGPAVDHGSAIVSLSGVDYFVIQVTACLDFDFLNMFMLMGYYEGNFEHYNGIFILLISFSPGCTYSKCQITIVTLKCL